MTAREPYTPGPADGAQVQKDGEQWTLVLVRELRHSPETVWEALTDPAHLREWAPFDADGSLGTTGRTVKLTTVGAPTPMVSETTVTRADAPNVLEYNWGGFDMRWELDRHGRRHAADALDQHRSSLTSRWAPRAGTSASMCSSGCSTVTPLAASSAPTR